MDKYYEHVIKKIPLACLWGHNKIDKMINSFFLLKAVTHSIGFCFFLHSTSPRPLTSLSPSPFRLCPFTGEKGLGEKKNLGHEPSKWREREQRLIQGNVSPLLRCELQTVSKSIIATVFVLKSTASFDMKDEGSYKINCKDK